MKVLLSAGWTVIVLTWIAAIVMTYVAIFTHDDTLGSAAFATFVFSIFGTFGMALATEKFWP